MSVSSAKVARLSIVSMRNIDGINIIQLLSKGRLLRIPHHNLIIYLKKCMAKIVNLTITYYINELLFTYYSRIN